MTQSSEIDLQDDMGPEAGLAPALDALVERQRALRSAWGVLAPSGLSSEKTDIAETGRTLNDELMALVGREPSLWEFEAMADIETRLDSLEAEMRTIACKLPVAQLRSTIPEYISQNRRGVLDLLDLMIGAELLGLDGTQARIPSIDYLITMLCSVGPDQPLQDPVQLTPRLHQLCEQSNVDYDPRLPEIEAEFFHAADMYEADAREDKQLHALRNRKAELGSGYFAPQVLRAIVTYNTALLNRIDEEILASQDWGSLPPAATEPEPAVSVFDSMALPMIAQALKRRLAGAAPEMNAIDRIAWCLDVEYLTAVERRALLSESVIPAEDLTGTVILVGLLCRASVVLEEELADLGISSTQLFDEWVPETSEALQQKVNLGISGDDYRQACMLSELKTRFLYTSMAEIRRKHRKTNPAPVSDTAAEAKTAPMPKTAPTAVTAKPILEEALVAAEVGARAGERPGWKRFPVRRLAAISAAIAGVLLTVGMGRVWLQNDDHMRLDRDQLDQVSPYLSRGTRDGKGQGFAFTGRIRDGWLALEVADRMLVASDLVEALRADGVRDVMIYDDDGALRIQALGGQPPRILPRP